MRSRTVVSTVQRLGAIVAGAALLFAPTAARACAVCFGDPNSDMAKGAVRGVAFMIIVTVVMLLSIASIAGMWAVRARRLAASVDHPAVDVSHDDTQEQRPS